LIIERIQKEFPDYNIIDEETGIIDNTSEFTWVIDPIDGTSNFQKGVPTYGIMLGLLKGAIPIAGGVILPYFNELYIAEKGKGTFCNDKKITVTSEKELLNTLVAYGIDGHQENPKVTHDEAKLLGDIILSIRNYRVSNSVFDILLTAKGSYGGSLNKTSKIWDNVAPHIIIEEAGGLYTDFYGKPIDYAKPLTKLSHNFTYCVASPVLHDELQKIIHTSNKSNS